MRRGLVGILVCCMGWSAVATGCQIISGDTEPQQASPIEDRSDEWLPIVDDEPLPAGDIRRLHNCAEYPFTSGGPGAWESFDGLSLADGATPRHRTTDRVARLGAPIELDATIEYDAGALEGEWVRLYVGDCHRWQLKGVRKTDEAGYVSFRLNNRLPAGVYGVLFQNVGDMTAVRGQLWVVSPKTEIVVIDVDGAAFDEREATDAEGPMVVEGAPERSKWHADRGRLVVYAHQSSQAQRTSPLPRLDRLRMTLRDEQFAVGPVVDLDAGAEAGADGDVQPAAGARQGQWGRSQTTRRAGPPLPTSVTKVYGGDDKIKDLLERRGIDVEEVVTR